MKSGRAVGAPVAAAKGYDVLQRQTFAQLQTLPGIGPATAADLIRLGVASIDDLGRRDPKALCDGLAALDGREPDPTVLGTYAAAIHAARAGEAVPWWEATRAAGVKAEPLPGRRAPRPY